MPAIAKKQPSQPYPRHQYAEQHKALRYMRENPRRRLRDAAELRASGEVACERIREFGWDVGSEKREAGDGWGWMAWTSRELGLNEATGWWILSGNATRVSTKTVDTVCAACGVPPRVFYDPEL